MGCRCVFIGRCAAEYTCKTKDSPSDEDDDDGGDDDDVDDVDGDEVEDVVAAAAPPRAVVFLPPAKCRGTTTYLEGNRGCW